jgi:hypothetical protein
VFFHTLEFVWKMAKFKTGGATIRAFTMLTTSATLAFISYHMYLGAELYETAFNCKDVVGRTSDDWLDFFGCADKYQPEEECPPRS